MRKNAPRPTRRERGIEEHRRNRYKYLHSDTSICIFLSMTSELRKLIFVGSSRNDLRTFPAEVRHAIGVELMRVQAGLMPIDYKAMTGVGAGCFEIRVRLGGAWRVVYVAKFRSAIYVLHAFRKKTQQTAKADLDLAAKR